MSCGFTAYIDTGLHVARMVTLVGADMSGERAEFPRAGFGSRFLSPGTSAEMYVGASKNY